MTTHAYLIEPKAPLIIRSGRPFDGQAGADEARFPPPSTLAGALRTAHAESTGKPLGPELAQLAVCGPLPFCIDSRQLLVPKPADALYFWHDNKTDRRLVRAVPQALSNGDEGCGLPDGLQPVLLSEAVRSKPAGGPHWWAFDDLIAWRSANNADPSFAKISQRGWSPQRGETRTHVGIEPHTQAGADGKLFQTTGLPFWQYDQKNDEKHSKLPNEAIGLLGRMQGHIDPGLITLGGERRLSALRAAEESWWPSMPADLPSRIRDAGGLTLTLLTPALFARGWRPPEIPGLQLIAAALDRWQPHSGWDLANWKPRAGRKLIPAGAVYWYHLDGSVDERTLANLWLSTLADHEQDGRDGFGLILPQPYTPK